MSERPRPATETSFEAYELQRACERWLNAAHNHGDHVYRAMVTEIARKAAALNGDVVIPQWLDEKQTTGAKAMQDHMAELLRLLGLGDHARPETPAAVMAREVIPAVRRLVNAEGRTMSKGVGHTDPCVDCGTPVPQQAGEPVCYDCTLVRGAPPPLLAALRGTALRVVNEGTPDDGPCWCEWYDGHEPACEAARAAIAKAEGRDG